MILLGFKSDWYKDTQGLDKYLSVIQHGLDLHLGVAILRLKNGTDYSSAIGSIEKIDRSVHVVNEEETGEME